MLQPRNTLLPPAPSHIFICNSQGILSSPQPLLTSSFVTAKEYSPPPSPFSHLYLLQTRNTLLPPAPSHIFICYSHGILSSPSPFSHLHLLQPRNTLLPQPLLTSSFVTAKEYSPPPSPSHIFICYSQGILSSPSPFSHLHLLQPRNTLLPQPLLTSSFVTAKEYSPPPAPSHIFICYSQGILSSPQPLLTSSFVIAKEYSPPPAPSHIFICYSQGILSSPQPLLTSYLLQPRNTLLPQPFSYLHLLQPRNTLPPQPLLTSSFVTAKEYSPPPTPFSHLICYSQRILSSPQPLLTSLFVTAKEYSPPPAPSHIFICYSQGILSSPSPFSHLICYSQGILSSPSLFSHLHLLQPRNTLLPQPLLTSSFVTAKEYSPPPAPSHIFICNSQGILFSPSLFSHLHLLQPRNTLLPPALLTSSFVTAKEYSPPPAPSHIFICNSQGILSSPSLFSHLHLLQPRNTLLPPALLTSSFVTAKEYSPPPAPSHIFICNSQGILSSPSLFSHLHLLQPRNTLLPPAPSHIFICYSQGILSSPQPFSHLICNSQGILSSPHPLLTSYLLQPTPSHIRNTLLPPALLTSYL